MARANVAERGCHELGIAVFERGFEVRGHVIVIFEVLNTSQDLVCVFATSFPLKAPSEFIRNLDVSLEEWLVGQLSRM